MKYTRTQRFLIYLIDQGLTFEELCERLCVSSSTLYYHIRRLRNQPAIESVVINKDRTITLTFRYKQLELIY